jgi:hypothetical protein
MARNYAAVPHEYLEEMAQLDDAEFGRLIRALLKYSISGETVELTGNERFYYQRITTLEDKHQASYEELCQKRREAGLKGAQSRWGEGFDGKNGKNGKNKNKNKNEKEKENKNKIYTFPPTGGRSEEGAERMRLDMERMERVLAQGERT